MFRSFRRLALTGCALLGLSGMAQAATLIGLTSDGMLMRIDTTTRQAMPKMRVQGVSSPLLGIDMRPADGKLYGVTMSSEIVTIDPASGRARKVSQLSEAFESGGRAVVDFNPVADRLRLMGSSGVNFRVNVENGQAVKDGTLKYQAGTPLAETMPRITAGAYTNSMAGAKETMLLTIDGVLRQLNLQAPPNDGVQQVRGRIGEAVSAASAFDILSDGGTNTGFLLAGGTLYTLDLQSAAATRLGPVAGSSEVIDIAAMR
ncbi:DUF4394 domain-containing protein [Roseomonas mucosa]|uniref:DUF4394 domain-containing protein n=1 Tax=Roseomonas mucosa TaxID=207340 RepID=UPI0028CEBDCE|nr:DUF4394 domain-containing protein [Roseomonas mucosa]MDT8276849.1 DUF4394 domain-containing protein [Roseomonas mucosa]